MTAISDTPEDALSLLRLVLDRLNSIESRINAAPKTWLTKHEAAALLNISITTLAGWRQSQWEDGSYTWQRGVHYVQQPGKSGQFEYNRILLEDWRLNRLDWKAHQRTINAWAASIATPSRRARKVS